MTVNRTFVIPNSLILAATGICALATTLLVAFPANLVVWQVGSWTLALALLVLLALVPASGYSLVTNRAARTWQRMLSFLLGLGCLAIIAVGAL